MQSQDMDEIKNGDSSKSKEVITLRQEKRDLIQELKMKDASLKKLKRQALNLEHDSEVKSRGSLQRGLTRKEKHEIPPEVVQNAQLASRGDKNGAEDAHNADAFFQKWQRALGNEPVQADLLDKLLQ